MNGYVVYIDGQRFEIYADTSFQAQQKALPLYRGRKKRPRVDVMLAELNGEQYTHVVDF